MAASLAAAQPYRWNLPPGFPTPRVPAGNPMSAAKVELGRYLFYDTRLSANRTQSCATCHRQELAFTDGKAAAVGSTGQPHPRSAMSLVNVAYAKTFGWSNLNVHSLEQQALLPILNHRPVELGLTGHEESMLDLLRSDAIYCDLFPKSFPESADPFTITNVAKALAAFERTILSGRSPYDRYYRSGDRTSISESAQRGEAVFFSDPVAGCFRCHAGLDFTDGGYHNTALYLAYPKPNLGIFEFTRRPSDIGKFKVPTLRNIALTAPYMHDGSIATLEEVIDHYAKGGRARENPLKDARMRPIALTEQNRRDLLEFLRSLTDTELIHDARLSNPW